MTYTNTYSEDIVSYVNYGKVESGIHLTTLKANLTRCENRNLKSIQQQKSNARIYQKAFSYTFAY